MNTTQHLTTQFQMVLSENIAAMANSSHQWYDSLQRWHLELFLIPASLLTLATLLANPILLACILFSRSLRQETRYLLLANTLAADMLFLSLNLVTVVCNTLGVAMLRVLCELVSAVTAAAYCCAVLTVTLKVVDTYVAVRWPLHYHDLLPPARTRKILVGVWLLAAMYPLSLVIVMEVMEDNAPQRSEVCLILISIGKMGSEMMVGVHIYFTMGAVVCTLLILYCYGRLYWVTKTQGIWQSRYSRARVTLLAHGVLLLLYFSPGLVFTVELVLYQRQEVSQDIRVWINTVNMCMLMLLPRACAPYLYGLWYRDISDTLLAVLHRRRRLSQVTVA
ncbi:probable G-protein coupled receptor 148 [Oncorhynchus kisutch]|uniref:probable G-protein coupled receptor 148 n=1 Tax=Oncorhynchus kisutch TaxID=8019 RepID=UPI00099F85BB|nr:probable G-protein coupled receptor 148 [Oncorhynchus kisutch]